MYIAHGMDLKEIDKELEMRENKKLGLDNWVI